MSFSISYPQSTYNIPTNQLFDISCIVVNLPSGYTLNFSITPSTLIIPLDFVESTGEITGTTNFSSISDPTRYTITATGTSDTFPVLTATASTQLTLSVNFSPQFYYPNYPTIFQLNKSLNIAPVPTFSNIPGIIYTLIGPYSNALTDISLNLNSITGVISGIPKKSTGLITYTVQANNSGILYDASLNISIQAIPTFYYPQTPYILTQNVPSSIFPIATQSNCTYSLDCILPFGLSLDPNTGVISGKPSILTTVYTYTVTITNSIGSSTSVITLSVIKEFLAPPVVADNFSSNTFLTDTAIAMRRKAEIFKYKKNSANLTKQQYYALLAKGNGPAAKRSWGTQGDAYTNPNESGLPQTGNTIICNTGIICAPTSSSDVPGPIMNLCYIPSAPFAGYNAPNRKKVNIGFKWPQSTWRPGSNGFPIGKAGSG